MTARDDLLAEVGEAFAGVPRPAMFIRDTCRCEECLEHEREMQSLPRRDMPLEVLGNPGWDAICFASDDALRYLMPGLVELALVHTDDYIQQFLWHLGRAARDTLFTYPQAIALLHVLDFLLDNETDALNNNLAFEDINRIRPRLQSVPGADF